MSPGRGVRGAAINGSAGDEWVGVGEVILGGNQALELAGGFFWFVFGTAGRALRIGGELGEV